MNTLPTVRTRYANDAGDSFVVVALHHDRGVIEISTVDGAIDEADLEAWAGMALPEIEPPDEWHGSRDDFLAARRSRPA